MRILSENAGYASLVGELKICNPVPQILFSVFVLPREQTYENF